jgi:hypothetical protein
VTHQVHLERCAAFIPPEDEQVFDVEAKQGLYDSKLGNARLYIRLKLQQKNRFDAAMEKHT